VGEQSVELVAEAAAPTVEDLRGQHVEAELDAHPERDVQVLERNPIEVGEVQVAQRVGGRRLWPRHAQALQVGRDSGLRQRAARGRHGPIPTC